MNSWSKNDQARPLAAAFTVVVIVVMYLFEEKKIGREMRTRKGSKNVSLMGDLIIAVGEMATAIRSPTHWIESLYEKVMEVDGFAEEVLVDVFDYLQLRESEARGFIVKKMALRKVWIEKYIASKN